MLRKILKIVEESPNLTSHEICMKLDVKFEDIRVQFTDLIKQGYLLEKMTNKPRTNGKNSRTPVFSLGSKNLETNNHQKAIKIQNKVFISHSYDDRRIVGKFIDEILVGILGLDKENDIFYTSHPETGIEPSNNWRDEIKANLKSKNIFIAIISERFKKSEMCLAEIGAAWVLDKIIYQFAVTPIKKSNCSKVLNTEQAISLTFKEDIKSFITSIQKRLKINTLNKSIDDRYIIKFVRTINTSNASIKKNLAKKQGTEKGFSIDDLPEIMDKNEYLLNSFSSITQQNKKYKKVNPNFLNQNKGTFMVWVDYNNDVKCNSYAYIVSHAGNKGVSIKKGSYDYPNVWAIRRILNSKIDIQYWEFTCSNNSCESINIKTSRVLSKGPHLFTITWNKSQGIIEFYIDQTREGVTKYKNWPDFIEADMFVGTWPTKNHYHYFNSKIGKIKILKDENVNPQFLDSEIKKFLKK